MTKEQHQDEPKLSQPPDVTGSTGGEGFGYTPGDSNDENPHMGGTRGPFSGGFAFPPPLYPDPVMLWMHHMQQQAAYLHLLSGSQNGYLHSTAGGPSCRVNQQGFIKIPSGIPQKQSKLWETQSAENVHLWAAITQLCSTIARAETEMSFQRVKIMKLEDDLQAMKVQQNALLEALKKKNTTTSTKQGKISRAKRNVTTQLAILGLPATQPNVHRAKKARAADCHMELTNCINEGDLEGRSKEMLVACTNVSGQDESKASTSPIVGLKGSGLTIEIHDRDRVVGQQTIDGSSGVATSHSTRQESQTNPEGSPLAEIPNKTQEGLEMNKECSATPHKDVDSKHADSSAATRCVDDCSMEMEGERDKVCMIRNGNVEVHVSVDCSKTNEVAQKDDWSEGILVDSRDSMEESIAFDNGNTDALNIISAGLSLLDCPNEQEEVPAFGQDAANRNVGRWHQDGGACI